MRRTSLKRTNHQSADDVHMLMTRFLRVTRSAWSTEGEPGMAGVSAAVVAGPVDCGRLPVMHECIFTQK